MLAPPRSHDSLLRLILAPLASLRLTVVLIVLSMFLIYAGTWAQIDQGIWQVQEKYFHSLVVGIDPAIFFKRAADGSLRSLRLFGDSPLLIPMLGGYTLGLLLLVNLLSAHALRFKGTWRDLVLIPAIALSIAIASAFNIASFWPLVALLTLAPLPILAAVAPLHPKRTGVIMIHLGLVMLLVGEGATSQFAVESRMPIQEGGTAVYSMDVREAELAVVDSSSTEDQHVAVPVSMLETGQTISHPQLPVDLHIDQYYPNSELLGPRNAGDRKDARATAGTGVGVTVLNRPLVTGVDTGGDIDFPAAYVTLKTKGDSPRELGTYLLTTHLDPEGWESLLGRQTFDVDGKSYTLDLRFRRLYKPYRVELIDFTHDRYQGTNIPKNFASRIRLIDRQHGVDREVHISMNQPLRYRGETFYQAAFMPGDNGTVLQVVRNPGWVLPYVACAVGAMGLTIHFLIKLFGFARKRSSVPVEARAVPVSRTANVERGHWLMSVLRTAVPYSIVVLGFLIMLAWVLRPVGPKSAFDVKSFGKLPVSYEGRVQPLDTLARTSLKIIAGRERAVDAEGKRIAPAQWLADVFGNPDKASTYPIFRIDNPELLGMLKLDANEKYFSLQQLLERRETIQSQIDTARAIEEKERDIIQRRMIELGQKISQYIMLGQMESLLLIPPGKPGEEWRTLGATLRGSESTDPAGQTWLRIIKSAHDEEPDVFNAEVASLTAKFQTNLPVASRKVGFEAAFHKLDPFTICIGMYLIAMVLALFSWLFWGVQFRRAAMVALLLALAIHTAGLIARVYISGRPPVTNLAASAIFIAWGAVVLAVVLEFIYRNGIGSMGAAIMGFSSLLIADRLALSGDTLKVLQAVLDTNFWLSTHVIVITLGYSATFLAGIIGIIYVIASFFVERDGPVERSPFLKDLIRMIYGITCFAILFSFVGTVLGGIWADQSWGRFWGWDPKENGAVLIVLANALLLHARWAGIARDRGIVALALFGNIITSWSWFGTNMLGVGLHSYGFMESALVVLLMFVFSQIVLIGLTYLPPLIRRG